MEIFFQNHGKFTKAGGDNILEFPGLMFRSYDTE
jgi:hypothetical protein